MTESFGKIGFVVINQNVKIKLPNIKSTSHLTSTEVGIGSTLQYLATVAINGAVPKSFRKVYSLTAYTGNSRWNIY